jgi:hypothetical protein
MNQRREMSEEESLKHHLKIVKDFYDEAWMQLAPREKALCLNYKAQIEDGRKVEPVMLLKINDIHEKYEDFHLGCIP